MVNRTSELALTIWIGLLSLVLIGVLTFGGFYINRALFPAWLGVQREAVQQSKSFVDSTNTALVKLKKEHGRLDVKITEGGTDQAISAYKAQQGQIVEQMCSIVSTMDKSTVDYQIISFVNEEGGC